MTWQRISCAERDRLYTSTPGLECQGSSTELEIGPESRMLTIWGTRETGWVVKDEIWPDDPDQGCEHHMWAVGPKDVAREAIDLYLDYILDDSSSREKAKKAAAQEMLRRHDPDGDALPDPAVIAEDAIEAYERRSIEGAVAEVTTRYGKEDA